MTSRNPQAFVLAIGLLCLSAPASMLKALVLFAMTGAVVFATAIPVVWGFDGGTAAETRGILLAATAFFGLAWALRSRSTKAPRRGGPTRPA